MKTYSSICIFTFLLSLVNEAFRPANATAVAHYSAPQNRTRSYSLNRLAINLGWAVGAGLGGLLASIHYSLLFWVDGITNICAAALLWKFIVPPTSAKIHNEAKQKVTSNSAYQDKFYLLFILFTTLFAMCFFQMFTNLPVFYKQDLHFSERFIGFLMALNGLIIAFIEMILVYHLEGRRSGLSYIFLGVSLCGISFMFYNIFPGGSTLAVSAMIVVTVGEILSMPFMNSFWIARSNNFNRGQYAGLYTIAWATAQVLGPVLGAQVVQHHNFNWLWWMAGGLCLFAAGGFLYMRRMQPQMENLRSEP